MKKILFLGLFVIATLSHANAQCCSALHRLGIFDHLGISVGAGTTGVSVDLSTPITPWVQLRGGVDIMPGITFSDDVDANVHYTANGVAGEYSTDINVKGDLGRTQGHVIFNFYPMRDKCGLFIAAGAYIGGSNILKLKGQATDTQLLEYIKDGGGTVNIGDYPLPIDRDGSVSGFLRTTSFRPYLGIGWGKPCPKKRVSFMIDLGVQFMGKLKVYDSAENVVPVDKALDSDDTYQKIMDKLTVYPVLKFTLNGRIF